MSSPRTPDAEPASRAASPRLRRAWAASTVVGTLGSLAGALILLNGAREQHDQPTGFGGFDVFAGVVIVAATLPSVVLFLVARRWVERRSMLAHVAAGLGGILGLLVWGTAAVDLGSAMTRSGAFAASVPLFLVLLLVALWHLVVLVWGIVTEYPGRSGS